MLLHKAVSPEPKAWLHTMLWLACLSPIGSASPSYLTFKALGKHPPGGRLGDIAIVQTSIQMDGNRRDYLPNNTHQIRIHVVKQSDLGRQIGYAGGGVG